MPSNIFKNRKSLSFAGGLFVTGASALALSACGIPKSDFNVLLRIDLNNLNYITQTGTDDVSSPTMESFFASDPLATNSKSSIQLAKSLNNPDSASEYATNIVNRDQVIRHEYDENGKVSKSFYSTTADGKQRIHVYLIDADGNKDNARDLTIDEATQTLGIGFNTFNYVWAGAQSVEIWYKTDVTDPANPTYYLYQTKLYLDQKVPGKGNGSSEDELNYWYSADEGFQNLEPEKREIKASDYAASARLDMDILTAAPYLYMWQSNVGLNGAEKCIDDQGKEDYIYNMLKVPSCAAFFDNPEKNPGSGMYADDEENSVTLTYVNKDEETNTGTNLPLSIVFNEFDSIVYWPVPQEFFDYKYGSLFSKSGPLWDPSISETLGQSKKDEKKDVWSQSSSAFVPALDSFGTTANQTASNGPFYISDWVINYQLRYEKSPKYRNKDEVITNSFTYQLGVDRTAILPELFNNEWLDRTEQMGYDYRGQIEGKNNIYLGAQPSSGGVGFLNFNTINGDANNPGEFELTEWGTRYFDGMKVRELATHSRNFRNAIVYAFDQGEFWKLGQIDNYAPLQFQGSDVATDSSISAPNKIGTEKDFQGWLNDTKYKVPDKNGVPHGDPQGDDIAAAALTSAEFQSAFTAPPEKQTLVDRRRNVEAAEYYWDQWVAEANSVKLKLSTEDNDPENFVLNVTGSGEPTTYTWAFAESFKGTKMEGKVKFQAKGILDYFNAGFYRSNEGALDMGTYAWSPDYLDPATFYGIYNLYDQEMKQSQGYWNYVAQLLELKFAGQLELKGFNDADALLGDNGEENENTLGTLGDTVEERINTILDSFSLDYDKQGWDGKISSLEVEDYRKLATINNSKVTGKDAKGNNQYVDPTGFSTLKLNNDFWGLSPAKRFAVMTAFELLQHYASPAIPGATEAIGYGADRTVGTARPVSGVANYRYVYTCSSKSKNNGNNKLQDCETLFPQTSE